MAIAFDASSSGQGSEPLTVNHTPTGTPTVVTAQAAYRNDQAITSWQYGGTDVVEEATVLNTVRVRIAQLVAPSSGAQDCVIDLASAVARLAMSVHSYTGTVDADPVDGATTTTGTSTQAALTVTSRTDDLVVDAVCFTGDTVPTVNIVVTGGQDSREVQKIGNNTNGIEFGSSTEAGATSVGVSWDVDNSLLFAYAAANIRAGSGATTLTPSAVAAALAVVTPALILGAVTLTPSPVTAALAVNAPTITNIRTLTPDPATAAFAVNAPSIVLGGVTLSPDPVTAAFAVNAPTVARGALSLTPDAVTAAWGVAAPTLSTVKTLTPDAVTAAWSVATPSVVLGALTLTPSAITAAYGVAAPTIVTGGATTLLPDPVVATWGVTAPTLILGAITVAPDAATASLAVAAPSVQLTRTLTPDAVPATWSVATPTLVLGAVTLAPTSVTGAFAVVAPTVQAGAVQDYITLASFALTMPRLASLSLTTATLGSPALTAASLGAVAITPN